MSSIPIVFATLVVACCCFAVEDGDGQGDRVQLTDVVQQTPLYKIAVAAQVSRKQKDSRGLTFDLEVRNEGNQRVDLKNPLDFIQLRLLKDDLPVALRAAAPKALVHSIKPLKRAFDVNEVKLSNGLSKSGESISAEAASADDISLDAQSSYTFQICISEIVAQANADRRTTRPPAGNYKIGLILSLIVSKGEGSRTLSADFVTSYAPKE